MHFLQSLMEFGAVAVLGITRCLMLQWLRTVDLSEQDPAPGILAGPYIRSLLLLQEQVHRPRAHMTGGLHSSGTRT